MNLLNILDGQWAIQPAKLLEISTIYGAHVRGEKIDLAAVEAKLGRPLQNNTQQAQYTLRDGVAIIAIDGVIAKRMNMLTQVSGGTSSQLVGQALQGALTDPNVHSIVLAIDSPGGTVDGTQSLANAVSAASQIKPVVTLASGCMCSAAYWIGSAARSVFIADGTTMTGSIGVVTSHTDISGAQEKQGLKTTEITAGKYKRIASQYGPLTADGRQSIQDSLDYTYGLFVDAVAKYRNASPGVVLRDMADGKVFIGKQAIDAGLVDGIIGLDALLAKLNSDRKTGRAPARAKAEPMTRAGIDKAAKAYQADHPGTDYLAAFKAVEHMAA